MSTPSEHAVNAAKSLDFGSLHENAYGTSIAAAIIQEHAIDPALAEKDAAINELVEALRGLADEQNGPPLIRHAESWGNAMKQVREMLAKHEGA